ncbi:MAG: DNA polymerase III subunit gamma/tau, partial [Eubacterium sp.]|nr:DNA polymerase III subunit gamma/tau [Eubacterium sp.]
EPCNECELCKGLDSGAIYDLVEIDAASNNGVDNIRDLREEANYTPSRGKYRVYIIDEVHMLSAGAFNALLKTLEEPPAHVIFILATTEVHKLPATILSRCQRFDFKRIQPETMAVRLKQVAGLENMTIDDDAAVLVARIADGALRDGLSILDQCAGRSSHIDSALVSEVAGLAGREVLHKFTSCIANSDSSTAIDVLAGLYQNSYDMERLCVEMINHFRNYLMVKTVKKSRELIICTDDEYNSILSGAENFTLENIIFALDLFQDTLTRIKAGANSRIEMEMAFIKLCEPKLDESNAAVLDRIAKLERAVRNGVSAIPKAAIEVPKVPVNEEKPVVGETIASIPKASIEETAQPEQEKIPVQENTSPIIPSEPVQSAPQRQEVQEPVTSQSVDFDQWEELMDILHKTDIALFGVLNGANGSIVGEHFVIDSPNPTIKEFIKIPTHSKAIKQAVFELTGRNLRLAIAKKKAAVQQKRDLLEDLINQAQNNINIKFE